MGEKRNQKDHVKHDIQTKWNPKNLGKTARYEESMGVASIGRSFYAPSLYAMDELHILLNLRIHFEAAAVKILR